MYKYGQIRYMKIKIKMATAPPPPPPPTPDEVFKVTGFSKGNVDLDPTKPLIGIAENSAIGLFIHTVDKQEIFNEMSRMNFENRDDQILIVCDGICPELLENLKQNELATTYPLRALLVYNLAQQYQHEQEVARALLNKGEPGVYQFISCSTCGNVLSVNSKFPHMKYIDDNGNCCICSHTQGL